ncbi:hypothetical protein C7G89_18595, partial [Acinetobacter baumannii]
MCPGRMRNGVSRSVARLGGRANAGRRGGTSASFGSLNEPPLRRSGNEACAYGGPSGTCALVALASGLSIRPVLKLGPRSLTCVRVGGLGNPRGARKLTGEIPSRGVHRRRTLIFCEGFECEHTCWDPKDGELCLSRAKPEETLVEARSDTDVQIVRL